ncbi:hypothetical protein [Novosphingobium sp.]|uniref:hypothetical protein n=1 Tax=Novosphingobium sp. TaxID=1874826 RepID=UPI003D14A894
MSARTIIRENCENPVSPANGRPFLASVGAARVEGIDLGTGETASPLLADSWLQAWEALGGSISIGPKSHRLLTWINFGSDRAAPGVAARLMGELLDTPGLPRAISSAMAKRIQSR